MTHKNIVDAYCRIRAIDQTIPDHVLDFMKQSALEKLFRVLPSDDEIDKAAIAFANEHCDEVNGDLTVETECFDAGANWMRNKLMPQ